MNAFVTPFATAPSTARPRTVCAASRPATPFFASAAFGSPIVTHAAFPASRAPVRMEVTIVVGDNEPVESALRRFKKDVSKSGHLFELRRRRYFETNTEKRLRKSVAARRKAKMARNESRKKSNTGAGSPKSNKNETKTLAPTSSSGTKPALPTAI